MNIIIGLLIAILALLIFLVAMFYRLVASLGKKQKVYDDLRKAHEALEEEMNETLRGLCWSKHID